MERIKIDNIREKDYGLQQLKEKELHNFKGGTGTGNIDFKVTGEASGFAELTIGVDKRIGFEIRGHVPYHP
jgi:hypothetical protein